MSEPPTPRPTPRGSLIVLIVLALVWLGWLAWYLAAPDSNPGGQCEGLGFGCTLTPRDLATFVGLLGLAPASALLLFVTGVVRVVRISHGSPRTPWDIVVWTLLAGGLGLWLAGVATGAF